MEGDVLDKYRKAGRICAQIRDGFLKKARPGMRMLELAEDIESRIMRLGGMPAFPVNISIDEVTAHSTPTFNDEREIGEGELVKIDVGVHVDGYIGDTAFTYCSEKSGLVEKNERLLDSAIRVVRPGIRVCEISEAIESAARENGVGLIVNLTGHGLDRFVFHGQPSIPNVRNDISHVIGSGDVIALEPFAVETNGSVRESGTAEIYRYLMDRPVRMAEARKMLGMARDRYSSLPFAKRWLCREFSPVKVSMALRQLESAGAIERYPVLKEKDGRPVSQAEHTIVVLEKPLVTTKPQD